MKTTLPALLVLLSATAASAGEHCLIDDGVMFTCTFNGGKKVVELCDHIWEDGGTVSYAFFERGKTPELVITRSMAELSYTPWNGMGRWIWDNVTIPADDGVYAYEVRWAFDKNGGETAEGSVGVQKDGEEIALLECDPGSVTHDLPGLIERIKAAQ